MKCSEENEVLRGIFRVVSCFHISCYISEILITFWTVYDQLRQYNRHCLSCYQVFDFGLAVTHFYPFIFFEYLLFPLYHLLISFLSHSLPLSSFTHVWFYPFLIHFDSYFSCVLSFFSICSVNFLIKTTLMIFYYTL